MTADTPPLLATVQAVVELRDKYAGKRGRRRAPTAWTHPPKPPPHALLKHAQVAAQLGVSPRTLDRLLHSGEIPASKVGQKPEPGRVDKRQWRIRQADVDAYIEEQRFNPLAGTWVADEWGDS